MEPMEEQDGGGKEKKAAVSCSIWLDAVAADGGRSTARLQCGHEFHIGRLPFSFSPSCVAEAMGATYRVHRLIISRSTYFRNMLHGPWREAGAPTVSCIQMMLMLIQRQLQLRWHIFTGSPPSLTITMRSVYLKLHHFWIFRAYVQYAQITLFLNFGHQTFYNISCLRKVKIMVVMENVSEMRAGVIFIKVPH